MWIKEFKPSGKPNLIIVRGGDDSEHYNYYGNDATYDILFSYYGDNPPPDACHHMEGTKSDGVDHILKTFYFEQYEYIWIPDNDLYITVPKINRMFEIMKEANAIHGHPAIRPESAYGHLLGNKDQFVYRRYTMVEPMAPLFRSDFLRRVDNSYSLNKSQFSFEHYWSYKINHDFEITIVIDETPVIHAVKFNSMNHGCPRSVEFTEDQKKMIEQFPKTKHQPIRWLGEKYK